MRSVSELVRDVVVISSTLVYRLATPALTQREIASDKDAEAESAPKGGGSAASLPRSSASSKFGA